MSIALPRFRVFSFEYWFQTPVVVAWAQFLSAIIAGLGMFAFCRRVLGVRFWVAAVMGWIYPFTGFFVLWLTYGTAKPICWLPWLLFALSSCLRGGSLLAAGGIAVVSCFVLTSGNPDMGGQVLLIGVLFGIWCLVDLQRAGLLRARLRNAALAVLAVVAGIMMASDYLLPYLEYGGSAADE